jgi:hypothetical protein
MKKKFTSISQSYFKFVEVSRILARLGLCSTVLYIDNNVIGIELQTSNS